MASDPQNSTGPDDRSKSARSDQGWPRWALWLLASIVMALVAVSLLSDTTSASEISYKDFLTHVDNGSVESVIINSQTGHIEGVFTEDFDSPTGGDSFTATGPDELTEADNERLRDNVSDFDFTNPQPGFLASWLPLLLPIGLLILFFWWMQRRAQGQMSGIMSIGRSKAKTYSTERPGTTFDDVAGYAGVKQEITEVVEFLKHPGKFTEVGARIPKGVLLVGPPGTGKTLIARAVAGEAGVPFLSVTGSDFMEMFVGVGASRVRDLFESARKMGRAIIFVDEIDSIGRKRGAGLGGGHDEREQTLNQMLSEMDGFEASEGIVMIGATNRPDILDPALLRPGRFDRQVIVPLPELDDRKQILEVHIRGKRIADDVDLDVVARGAPGMSGADLANLVNEAALHAVRAGDDTIRAEHFDQARDRVLMGTKRESMVLSDSEKEAVAYHESGHALCAALLPTADPLHKVTIIPSGMALGVTMQLPIEERHIYRQDYIEDRLVVMLGGRMAEDVVYGIGSTGANDDLVRATEMATKMVREWGMSEKLGPMAWGQNNQVFLGDGMMSGKDYSDDTARIIDEEVERILREQESRCHQLLVENRDALNLLAKKLLEDETISGVEVDRLIDVARTPELEPADADSTLTSAAKDVPDDVSGVRTDTPGLS
ncbi:MAG: ATP-dependent zinc metalloprotease FtsH [Acidimicrobiales bacterium]